MKKNEVSDALKELLKKAGVRQPSDLLGKVITIRLDYEDKSTDLFFQKITKVCISTDSSNLLNKIILKLSGSEYFYLQYDQENKFWQYCERHLNSDEARKKWSAEFSFPKKWWEIF